MTGGEGFIGGHCILQLLAAGQRVRATVLSLKWEPEVRSALKANGAEVGDRLSFVVADLERDEGWGQAVEACDYVLHVASPFPPTVPKHEDELIIPAREGALRVLRAARAAHVNDPEAQFRQARYGADQQTLDVGDRCRYVGPQHWAENSDRIDNSKFEAVTFLSDEIPGRALGHRL